MASIDVIIVAAGSSTRLPGDVPKVYRPWRGKAVLRHSIETFQSHPEIRHVHVVINPEHKKLYQEATKGLSLPEPVMGGATRQVSVNHGLSALRAQAPEKILIHDAARPGVDHALISRVITSLETHQAVVPVLPVKDTIKQCSAGGIVIATHPRDTLAAVQTPQGFYYGVIASAHARCGDSPDATDDASLAEALGIAVSTVEGSPMNDKLTTLEDWNRMQHPIARSASGFDVHRLIESDKPLMLCGIEIASPYALDGHSDADVALHALVDAMLGSIAAGDIGMHFPPSDAEWKGAASSQFVTHALSLLQQKNAQLVHVDVTLICETPKLSAHRDAMRENMAALLGLPLDAISVKATTTEGLGFTGRKEGIAAQAMVTIVQTS